MIGYMLENMKNHKIEYNDVAAEVWYETRKNYAYDLEKATGV